MPTPSKTKTPASRWITVIEWLVLAPPWILIVLAALVSQSGVEPLPPQGMFWLTVLFWLAVTAFVMWGMAHWVLT